MRGLYRPLIKPCCFVNILVSISGIPLTVLVSSTDRSFPIFSKIVKLTIDNYTTILIRSWLKECVYC